MPGGSSMRSDAGSGNLNPAAATAGLMSFTKSFMHSPESRFFNPCSMAYRLPAVPGRPLCSQLP